VGSVPVWFGAQVTGATNPTLIRSALALFVGTLGSVLAVIVVGPPALFFAPISFLLAFKFVLGTSFLGALMLCILAVFGYFLMGKFIGGGFSMKEDAKTQSVMAQPFLLPLAAAARSKQPQIAKYGNRPFIAGLNVDMTSNMRG
jgi:hypothetical protein